ncbi:universal stress protein [Microbacterium sp. cx-59]|uniref:universal stress protein n=1 Tax=Microbacterium sp. cx-59 TaxID=2891207 RepID=UPI001E3219FF|nr:universal stress protein [Microbacterium sp. cx-59]MCC4908190.1 universal stress protein [Microbacterium sp. cx-59]
MPGTIVVGVADAPSSQSALEWAVERARRTGETVELVAVVGGAVGVVGEDDVVDRLVTRARTALDAEASGLTASGLSVTARAVAGDPVGVLVEASATADLLVIGGEARGHGRRGHHGARIAAGAHSPVVVVPATSAADAERRGIVVGVDGSDASAAAIEFAAAEAARGGDALTLVSAWLPVAVPGDFGVYPDTYLTDLAGVTEAAVDAVTERIRAAHPDLTVRAAVVEGDPAEVIAEHARKARLTVVGSHGRGALARFLLGSVSEEVIGRLAGPTAVVR